MRIRRVGERMREFLFLSLSDENVYLKRATIIKFLV
jgi:hypothetical protein